MIQNVWPLLDAAGMRALDRYTIEDQGVPGQLLMESAGRALVEVVLARRSAGATSAVLCGLGNNAGDGLVAARHLHQLGVPVRAVFVYDPARLVGDAAANFERARAVGVPIETGTWSVVEGEIWIDALFGTGLDRPVEGEAARAIERLNRRPPTSLVIAADLPSGLSADTGQILGCSVRADATVTFGLPKLGLALPPGRGLAGRITVARIGVADSAPGWVPAAELWTQAAAAAHLPERFAFGHKGHFGHVLVIAGSEGKTGAAALSALGAQRAGAGLVTVACPASLNEILEGLCMEAMTAPVAETKARTLAAGAEVALLALAQERDVVALGPGIGRDSETGELVRSLALQIEKPLVIDADALYALAGGHAALQARRAPTILTPHPGEAARLLSVATSDINRDRLTAARRLAEESGAVVVLKGAGSVIAAPGERTVVNSTGGPLLASGGSGDVLTGMVAALLAQGLAARAAAVLAVFLHGWAADRLAARSTDFGSLASEVAREVPLAAEALREKACETRDALQRAGLLLAFPEP